MRILLTGKNGQVGFELQRALSPLGEIVAIDHAECDFSDEVALRALVRSVAPNVIVNPAAYTAVDKAEIEPDAAFTVNGRAPGIFGQEAAKLGALVVHYSTDYVFDGTKEGFYSETDTPNPQCIYGASKLAGEQALLESGARCLIFRTSWVVGAHGNNFAKTMLRLASERDNLAVVADQFGAPTSAALLADITAHVVREAFNSRDETFPHGIFNLVASGVCNWHEYACYVIEQARAAGGPIKVAPEAVRAIATADYHTPARRPANSRMATGKLRQAFGLHLPDWQHGVDHILEQIL